MTTKTPTLLDLIDPPKPKKIKKATAAELKLIAGPADGSTVPFGSLRLSDNIREDVDTDIGDLAESIRTLGVLQAPGVRSQPDPDGGEQVIVVEVGHRRYMALAALGLGPLDAVPVQWVTAADLETRTLRQWEENNNRRALSPLDEARTIETLVTRDGMTVAAAAKHLSLTRPVASKRRSLLDLPQDAQTKVEKGDWDIEAAQMVGRMIRAGAPTETTDALVGSHRSRVEVESQKLANEKARAKLKKDLESRGMIVVEKLTELDAPKGKRLMNGEQVNVTDTAAVKAIVVSKLKAFKVDKKPVVQMTAQWDGEAHVRTVVAVKAPAATKASEKRETMGDDWDSWDAACEMITATRVAALTKFAANGGTDKVDDVAVWRNILNAVARWVWSVDMAVIAEVGGVDVVMVANDDTRIDRNKTIAAWVDNDKLTAGQARAMVITGLMLHGIGDISDDQLAEFGEDETPELDPVSVTARFAIEQGGIRGPVEGDEFKQVQAKVTEKLKAAAAETDAESDKT